MNTNLRNRLFLMMVLEIAIWGAWQVQIFNYMPLLKFEGWQMNLAGSMFAFAPESILSVGRAKMAPFESIFLLKPSEDVGRDIPSGRRADRGQRS